MTPLPSPRIGEERPEDRRLVQSFSFLGSFWCCRFRRQARLEGLAAFVDGQQIGDEFARHGERGAVAMSTLQLAGMQRRQLRIPSWRQLAGMRGQTGLTPKKIGRGERI